MYGEQALDVFFGGLQEGGGCLAREALHGGQQKRLPGARRQRRQAPVCDDLAVVIHLARRLERRLRACPYLLEDLVEPDARLHISRELIGGLKYCLKRGGYVAIATLLVSGDRKSTRLNSSH